VRALQISASGAGSSISQAEIEHLTERTAAGLLQRGIGAGDVVLVRLPKGLRWLAAMRALHRIAAVSLPCPHMLTEGDVADRAARSQAVAMLLEDSDVPTAEGPAPLAPAAPTDPAFLLYTSGTEGPPKGALHSRSYVAANRLQSERWMGVRAGDRVWCTAAAGWSKSLRNVWLAAELCDAETVIHEGRFDAAERLAMIATLKPDVLCMSPTEYRMCARSADFERSRLGGIREAVAAGEALDSATVEAWRSAHGVYVRDGYGQTETGAVAGVCSGQQAPAGSMGRPLPGVEIAIIDGELCVRAGTLPTLFAGYLNDPKATAERLRDGWWHTGDQATEDDDGVLWYVGRSDDVISSAGYRIGPGEVEAALRSHPAVLEAAAVGLPDPDRGQIVHADVVLRPAFAAGDELEQELRLHARASTAPYKAPRSLRFVSVLPRTTTGKVRRAAIRDELVLLRLEHGDADTHRG
jgi:acyl-coenzyme A synthetase/AMP-(fatty) acid ligase